MNSLGLRSAFLIFFAIAIMSINLKLSAESKKQETTQTGAFVLGKKQVTLEIADTVSLRAQGLMYRTELCQSCGMIFVYDKPRNLKFWMKNTYIPLDLAFVDQNGIISQISSLEPHDLEGVRSDESAQYVIEMNKGWFSQNNVYVGEKVDLSPIFRK